MSDKTIRVELTEDEARLIAHGSGLIGPFHVVAEQCRAALPPEYAEGTVAWVTRTDKDRDRTWICTFDAARDWLIGGRVPLLDQHRITKVEPLRVLADDEIAVPVPTVGPDVLRHAAKRMTEMTGLFKTAHWIESIADALGAQARP